MLVCSFVFTGFRVDVATPQKLEHGLFAPVFASIIVLVIVIEVMLALSYRNVFWFRYSTPIYTRHTTNKSETNRVRTSDTRYTE